MSIVLQAARKVIKRCAKLPLRSFEVAYKPVSLNYKPQFNFSVLLSKKTQTEDNFSHLETRWFQNVQEATNEILNLDHTLVNEAINVFRENIFPHENRKQLPKLIEGVVRNYASTIGSKKDVEAVASDLLIGLKRVMDFLDKADKGFLTGDLTLAVVLQVQKQLNEGVPKLVSDNVLSYIKRGDLITKMYDQIYKVVCDAGPFRLPLHGIPHPTLENPRNLFERQLGLEDESKDIAIERFLDIYDELEKLNLTFNLEFARSKIVEWFPALCKVIKDEQEKCLLGDLKGDRKSYAPYLVRVTPEKLSLISLTELMKAILRMLPKKRDEPDTHYHGYNIISKVLFQAIGKAVNVQILFDFEEEMNKIFEQKEQAKQLSASESQAELKTLSNMSGNPNPKAQQKQKLPRVPATSSLNMLRKKLDSNIFQDVGIPKDIQVKIGSLLTYLMKETIRFRNQEGFNEMLLTSAYSKMKSQNKLLGTLQVNEEFVLSLIAKVDQSKSMFIQMDRCLPMIFKPAPWQDYEIGGYYQQPTNFMRIHESMLQERSIKYANLQPMFQVLDILSGTPWRINKKILEVVEALWEEGGGIGVIPKRQYNFREDYVYGYQLAEARNEKERMKLMKKIQEQRDIHSLRCDFSLKLAVAKAFQGIDRIYFPHNIDFRGRTYPIPPHLNHMGADLSRGLLEFAEGKPIGPTGIRWLKIHTANKMGQDKLSIEDRIRYVDTMMPLIRKCTEDPLKNREWASFEDSWQTLASMYELVAVLESKNPEQYISHIHIHQDGSCNGLQHYAALGRDYAGAVQVNLAHGEKPGDIYTHVANMVQERVKEDSENPSSKYHNIAKRLVGNVKRKIVKQTVMTTVYGVTFIGARKQIYRQLKDKAFMEDDDKAIYEASYYIALLTLDSVKNLFSGAHAIKAWLIQCAALIGNTSYPVSWITPLGLPVIQPYRSRGQMDVISTILQKVTLSTVPDNLPINKNKQKSAFPPNYIHSLDSTHLMYTAMECHKENITFSAVHDSYWTHLATIDQMNGILRDQFVKLHSEPLLENLKESFERRYPDLNFPEIPARGTFNLEEVKKSQYFFA